MNDQEKKAAEAKAAEAKAAAEKKAQAEADAKAAAEEAAEKKASEEAEAKARAEAEAKARAAADEAEERARQPKVITVMTQVGLMVNPLTGQEIDTGERVDIVNPDGWIMAQIDAKKLIEV